MVAVEPDDRRMAMLQGEVLDSAADRMLDELVQTARERLATRSTALCLLLRHSVVFRASVELPRELFYARAMRRDRDPCAQVVHTDAPVVIEDAAGDPEMRAQLESHAARSYLGAPVRLHDTAIGALAAYDEHPRSFTSDECSALQTIASACSRRLAQLSRRRPRHRELIEHAVRPAFAELRNTLVPFEADFAGAHTTLDALASEAAHLRVASSVALDRLRGALRAIEDHTQRLQRQLLAVEGLVARGDDRPTVGEIAKLSDRLAHHYTKLAGGVQWHLTEAASVVNAPPTTCIGLVVRALSLLALRTTSEAPPTGLVASFARTPTAIDLAITAPVSPQSVAACARELEDLAHHTTITVAHRDAVHLYLPV